MSGMVVKRWWYSDGGGKDGCEKWWYRDGGGEDECGEWWWRDGAWEIVVGNCGGG